MVVECPPPRTLQNALWPWGQPHSPTLRMRLQVQSYLDTPAWEKAASWPHPGIFVRGPVLTWPSSPVWAYLAPGTLMCGKVQGLPGEGSPWCSCRGRAPVTSQQLPFPSFSMSHVSKSGPGASGSQTVVVRPAWPERGRGSGPGGTGRGQIGRAGLRGNGRQTLDQGRDRQRWGRRQRVGMQGT